MWKDLHSNQSVLTAILSYERCKSRENSKLNSLYFVSPRVGTTSRFGTNNYVRLTSLGETRLSAMLYVSKKSVAKIV